jgi:23S rRNA (pseudouridine1915-N3)-methyltransferase
LHLWVYTVGRSRDAAWQQLSDVYLARIRHYVRCDIVECKDDGELVRKWPKGDVVIAMEVHGKQFTSTEFARSLERWGSQGKGQVCLVVGGTEGIPEECSNRATQRVSLSSMTLPHRFAKVLLMEQLYRALTILRGEPYARET